MTNIYISSLDLRTLYSINSRQTHQH